MKIFFLFGFLFFTSSVIAQSLKDSLFGGKLKADTGKTLVSKDTSKYVERKNENISSQPAENKMVESSMPDNSIPDSLNKLYYAKQKVWKRFIEINTTIISQQADDSRKVKKGKYLMEVEYEIGLNGRITTSGITCSPQNEFLIQQVTELMKRTPVLSPPVYNDGKPGKLNAKQPITITKK